jgi:PAS domain S-box-containing protein
MLSMARRGEYGPGDPLALATSRVELMLKLLEAGKDVSYQRQLATGRWIEGRLRSLDQDGMLMLYRDITTDKKHESELARQVTLLETICANFPGGISVFDADWQLTVWNERYAELIGVDPTLVRQGAPRRELVISQLKAGEFGLCDNPDAEADRLLAVHAVEPVATVERIRPNGQTIEVRRSPLAGGGLVSLYIDITERKKAMRQLEELNATLEQRIAERTAALAESERFMRAVLTSVPGMAYRCRNDRDWTMIYASEGCQALLGIPAVDLVDGGVIYDDLIHPDEKVAVWEKVQADFSAGRQFDLEYRVRHADGSWRWVWDRAHAVRSASGEVITMEGFILDITARKAAEIELARTKNNLSDAMESIDHGILLYDNERRLILLNREVQRQFAMATDIMVPGIKFDDMIARIVDLDGIKPGPGMTKQDLVAQRVAMFERADGLPYERHLRDGRVLHISDRPTASGGRVSVGIDVTDRLRMEDQLRESQRMEAIGQLTGGLAHDLNNYLAVIMGNLDMLADHPQADPEVSMLIEGALGGAQRGADLVRSLLAFSRRQPLAPKVQDIAARIEDVARLLKRTIGERIALRLDIQPGLWPVMIDGAQLDSAIVNLANNARDAMPAGGNLTIAARNASAGSLDALTMDCVVVEVSDTGMGMSGTTRARVFEPFFSTKGPGHGTGLGLSMVHGFVHQSGGEVRVESKVGEGSTLRLFLPRSSRQPSNTKAGPGSGHIGGSETILVAEDNDDVRQTVMEQLTSLGYRPTAVASGQAALAVLEKRAGEFDLVFSDVVMPGKIDGLELAGIVGRRWPSIGILLSSGFTNAIFDQADQPHGAPTVLRKPYRKAELARAIRAALAKNGG